MTSRTLGSEETERSSCPTLHPGPADFGCTFLGSGLAWPPGQPFRWEASQAKGYLGLTDT